MKTINFGYDGVLLNDPKHGYFTGAPPGYLNGPYNSLLFYFDDSILNIPSYFAERLCNIKFPVEDLHKAARNSPYSELVFSLTRNSSTVHYLKKGQNERSYPYVLNQADFRDYLKNDEFFIFPYFPNVGKFFNIDSFIPAPPHEVLRAAQTNKCQIAFIYLNEGHVYEEHQVTKLYKFAKKYNLNSSNLKFYHCNLILKDTATTYHPDINKLVDFIPVPFFELDLWFNPRFNRFFREETYFESVKFTKDLLKEYRKGIKPNRFLCLNRMARGHRFNICSYLGSVKEVNDNSLWSLGPVLGATIEEKENSHAVMKTSSRLLLSSICNTDSFFDNNKEALISSGITLDEPTFGEKNLSDQINIDLHKKTYISIITETEVDSRTIFFSEKIYKPISVYHPFILLGSPYSLEKLREFGYKTFDKWWDESYDLEKDYSKRFLKIVKLIEKLNKLPIEELHSMIMEMEPVLTHNFNLLYSSNRHEILIDRLADGNPRNITRPLI